MAGSRSGRAMRSAVRRRICRNSPRDRRSHIVGLFGAELLRLSDQKVEYSALATENKHLLRQRMAANCALWSCTMRRTVPRPSSAAQTAAGACAPSVVLCASAQRWMRFVRFFSFGTLIGMFADLFQQLLTRRSAPMPQQVRALIRSKCCVPARACGRACEPFRAQICRNSLFYGQSHTVLRAPPRSRCTRDDAASPSAFGRNSAVGLATPAQRKIRQCAS